MVTRGAVWGIEAFRCGAVWSGEACCGAVRCVVVMCGSVWGSEVWRVVVWFGCGVVCCGLGVAWAWCGVV